MTPTETAYKEIQFAYDYFNQHLFGGELPDCLLTFQREKKTYGYFSAERFVTKNGERTDEIALNPRYFAIVPVTEVLQTVAHEQCHLWQAHFGKPGRGRYHNKEWAEKMESIGLIPSSTGEPGGKRTGDNMADYIEPGGIFEGIVSKLLKEEFKISWYDRFPGMEVSPEAMPEMGGLEMEIVSPGENTPTKSTRMKYSCPDCGVNVWGKPNLNITCGECGVSFEEQQ